MTLKYKVIHLQASVKDGTVKDLYYARAVKRRKVDVDELSKMISQMSSFSRPDVIGVLTALSDIIPTLLIENKTVQLGDLGTFSLHFKSDCADSPDKVSYRSIKGLNIRFRVGKWLKENLTDIHFKRVE
jgi:predicted histone-like DNA-binding protein